MSSTTALSGRKTLRRYAILAAALLAVVVPAAQALMGWGQDQRAFAADSDEVLKVAGYAFSIWGLIYAGILIYAVRQALPGTPDSSVLQRLGWPSVGALVGIAAWIVAAAFDWETATIVIIFLSAFILTARLIDAGPEIRALSPFDGDRLFAVWPLGMLAGWLTIAAPVNLITVLVGNGDLPDFINPIGWTLIAVLGVMAVTLAVTARIRSLSFPLPVAWGLIGVFVAEQARNPILGFSALGAAVAILLLSGLLVLRDRH